MTVLARAIPTNPDTYPVDLSVDMIAALRQAWDGGYPFVNVVGLLGFAGYELRIVPTEQPDMSEDDEYQFAQMTGIYTGDETAGAVETVIATLADRLGVSKGISFEVENRIIARNRKRKMAQEPHPFKVARWATRAGLRRCVTCGMSESTDGACAGLAAIMKAKPHAVVTDLDDTLIMGSMINERLGEYLRAQAAQGVDVIIVSGRPVSRLDETRAWLEENDVPHDEVHLSDFPEGPNASREFKTFKAGLLLDRVIIDRWFENDSATRRALEALGVNVTGPMLKADTYTPPEGVRAAAARAIEWISEGHAGDGFTAVGRKRASDLAAGRPISAETIKRMNSYFARHEVDRQAEGFNAGEDGFPSPGRVAWDAWGGDAGRSWAGRIMDELMKDSPDVGSVHVDTIMTPARRRDKTVKAYEPELSPRQEAMYEAYELIAETFGEWDETSGSEGAHYMPAAGNPFARTGIACKNCIFYEGGGGCELLTIQVEPEGACKLWVIDGALINEQMSKHSNHGDAAAFSKADTARRYTMGPMYVPDVVDAHGEWTDAEELQSAVWEYVRAGDRQIRLQHNRDVVAGEWVECMAWPYPVTVPMQHADGSSTDMTYPPNTVFLGVVWEPWAWELVKSGKLRGYSMGGKAERIMTDLPDRSTSE